MIDYVFCATLLFSGIEFFGPYPFKQYVHNICTYLSNTLINLSANSCLSTVRPKELRTSSIILFNSSSDIFTIVCYNVLPVCTIKGNWQVLTSFILITYYQYQVRVIFLTLAPRLKSPNFAPTCHLHCPCSFNPRFEGKDFLDFIISLT